MAHNPFARTEGGVMMLSSMTQLRHQGEYSDLAIICGEERHLVHKAIICTRLDFFRAACSFGQTTHNEVTLPEDKPLLVGFMIDYIYELDYNINKGGKPHQDGDGDNVEPESLVGDFYQSVESDQATQGTSMPDLVGEHSPETDEGALLLLDEARQRFRNCELVIHAEMYALAEKYGLSDLKDLATRKLVRRAEREDEHEWLKMICAIDVAYTTTIDEDRNLRDAIIEVFSYQHSELMDRPELKALLKEDPKIGYDLLRKVWERAEGARRTSRRRRESTERRRYYYDSS